jgi:transcriptional regulator with XRE-family HTH domain
MQPSNQLGDFLRAKRELLTPEDVGLPATGRRRVQGLRREEAALVAGIDPELYQRLEHGLEPNPSEETLEGITRALKLDEESAAQLRQIARPGPERRRDATSPEEAPATLAALINRWPHQASYIQGRLMGVLAANPLAMALSPIFTPGTNGLRAAFLDPAARELYPDWEGMLSNTIAGLRALIGPNVDDPQLAQLVGELSVRSAEFRALWAQPVAALESDGILRLRHPQIGALEVHSERLAIEASDGQFLVILHAQPGSASETALRRLASIVDGTSSSETQRSMPAPVPIESRRRLP